MDTSKREIAAAAARLVVEEGLEYGPAKRRALRDLGLSARTALPNNDEVEAEVRDYIELFCADTQPQELHALRKLALEWMERMAVFRPYVGGAVWHGTATRLSDIYIQLFCDDSKSAEIALIDHHVDYEPRMVTGFHGEHVEALSVHATQPGARRGNRRAPSGLRPGRPARCPQARRPTAHSARRSARIAPPY
jgi:hypothetical protein